MGKVKKEKNNIGGHFILTWTFESVTDQERYYYVNVNKYYSQTSAN